MTKKEAEDLIAYARMAGMKAELQGSSLRFFAHATDPTGWGIRINDTNTYHNADMAWAHMFGIQYGEKRDDEEGS